MIFFFQQSWTVKIKSYLFGLWYDMSHSENSMYLEVLVCGIYHLRVENDRNDLFQNLSTLFSWSLHEKMKLPRIQGFRKDKAKQNLINEQENPILESWKMWLT